MYDIQVKRSFKRLKTVSARLVATTLHVNAPHRMPERELEKMIDHFQERFRKRELRKAVNREQNLDAVARKLNGKYFEGRLHWNSIEYVTNHVRKYGCCDCRTREIRISHRLAAMPAWVRDYLIVHELAHLIEPNHSARFWALVNRYPYTERAKGYLLAKGMEETEVDDRT